MRYAASDQSDQTPPPLSSQRRNNATRIQETLTSAHTHQLILSLRLKFICSVTPNDPSSATGPRDAWTATGARWPGSLERMVRGHHGITLTVLMPFVSVDTTSVVFTENKTLYGVWPS